MNRRGAVRRALLLAVGLAVGLAALAGFAGPVGATAPAPDPPPPSAPATVNEFVGEREDFFEDCVGTSLQRPECGSPGRGGWRQAAVFGVVTVGMALVFWRVSVGVRRNRTKAPPTRAP